MPREACRRHVRTAALPEMPPVLAPGWVVRDGALRGVQLASLISLPIGRS